MNKKESVRVLLVDDEERFRTTATAILTKRGFEVKAVAGGAEALGEIRRGGVDVVVLDVKMPGMDGNEALREIKILEPELEVIMLTGYGSLGSALEGWHEGVFAYLTKPSSIDFLAERIREAFDRKTGVSGQERRVKDIMEPLSALIRTIHQDQSVAEAIEAMRQFFAKAIAATKRKETLLRSILVTDNRNKIIGVISLTDLLRGLQPPCMRLSDDRPSMADSDYLDSPNYPGNFATMVREMASKRVKELMPDNPPTVDANADLLQAANRLLSLRVQSLLVMDGDEAVGVVRDKDLFLEIASIVRERPAEAGAS